MSLIIALFAMNGKMIYKMGQPYYFDDCSYSNWLFKSVLNRCVIERLVAF